MHGNRCRAEGSIFFFNESIIDLNRVKRLLHGGGM